MARLPFRVEIWGAAAARGKRTAAPTVSSAAPARRRAARSMAVRRRVATVDAVGAAEAAGTSEADGSDIAAGVDDRHLVGVLRARRRHLRADRVQHVGRVGVGRVVDETVGEAREVVDLGAEAFERLPILGLGRVDRADALARLGDRAGERQGAIVGGGEDGDFGWPDMAPSAPRRRPCRCRARRASLRRDGRREVAIAGDRRLAQGLHRQPAAHRMGEHMDFADARRRADLLQAAFAARRARRSRCPCRRRSRTIRASSAR